MSISETDGLASSLDPVSEPLVGGAHFSVYNVAPRNGAVEIRVHIDWSDPLPTQVSYLVMNP